MDDLPYCAASLPGDRRGTISVGGINLGGLLLYHGRHRWQADRQHYIIR